MKPFLVTGGAGFIGSHVVDALLKEGFRVRVLDSLRTGKKENLSLGDEKLEVIQGDVRNWKTVQQAVEGVVGVVHLAAQPSVPYSIENPRVSTEINLLGFTNLLDALRKSAFTGKLVYASSAVVYGENETKKTFKEKDKSGKPMSPHALEISMVEEIAALYQRLYGLQSLGMRFFNVYGPRQEAEEAYGGVIATFAKKMKSGENLPLNGDGDQTRDFIYVQDAVDIVLKALISNRDVTGVINVGTGKQTTLNDVVATFAKVAGKEAQVLRQSNRPGDIRHMRADIKRLKSELDANTFTSLEAGVKAVLESMATPLQREQAPVKQPAAPAQEQEVKLAS